MNEKMVVEDFLAPAEGKEIKRNFRWFLDVAGLTPWTVSSVNCGSDESGNSMLVEYMSELRKTSKIERPQNTSGSGTLKMLDVDGTIVEELRFTYDGYDFMPYIFLDYTSASVAKRAVVFRKVVYEL